MSKRQVRHIGGDSEQESPFAKVHEVVKQVHSTGHLLDGTRACLLCNDSCPDEVMIVGVFLANREHQQRIGCSPERLARGGARFLIYQLCPGCMEQPTVYEDVEVEILRRATVQ